MIDVENYVVNEIAEAIKGESPEVHLVSSHVRTPSEFPCVMVYESGNATFEPTRWVDGVERHAELRYTIEVCTNDKVGKKENAKRLAKKIDDVLQGMGFYRASRQYNFQTADSSIFIITMAYRGLVGEGPESSEANLYVYRR